MKATSMIRKSVHEQLLLDQRGMLKAAVRAKREKNQLGNQCAPLLPATTTGLKIDLEPGYGIGEYGNEAQRLWQPLIWGNQRDWPAAPIPWHLGKQGQLLRKHKNTVETRGGSLSNEDAECLELSGWARCCQV